MEIHQKMFAYIITLLILAIILFIFDNNDNNDKMKLT